jgi:preprotein translocase subunit SecE
MNKVRYFFTQFLPEVRGEWKKVTRPSRREVTQTTIVVVVTSFVFAIYLWGADKVIVYLYSGVMKVLGP